MKTKTCDNCRDGSQIMGTKECLKCVNFSEWKDVEG